MSGKKHIKTWVERCEEHPDHNGIVSERMIKARMQEEIDELREEYERLRKALSRIAKIDLRGVSLIAAGSVLLKVVDIAKAALRREQT